LLPSLIFLCKIGFGRWAAHHHNALSAASTLATEKDIDLHYAFDVKAVSEAVMLDSPWVSKNSHHMMMLLGVARHQPKQIRRRSFIVAPHNKNT
jgi:hypothetical protein